MAKKRAIGSSTVATTRPSSHTSTSQPVPSGFSIKDMNSGATFLIDTGAFVSVYPFKSSDAEEFKADTSPTLIAANGTSIRTYGTVTKSLQFSNQSYTWKFLLADVNLPLIGADFLSHYELLVDVANRRLVDSQSLQCHSRH